MVVVAVAGTGLVGKQVIHALLSSGKHTVIVLSRSPKPTLTAEGALVKAVDYSSVPSLVSALSDSPEPVHTVISCLVSLDPSDMVKTQINLLQAAKQVGAKRFAPSEFAVSREANQFVEFYREFKEPVWKAAEESGLEVTAFSCGIFTNYLAHGSSNVHAREELEGIENSFPVGVDIKEGRADIPGTGKEIVTFTRWQDVGKFVAAAVELERWEKESSMAGDAMSYDEVIKIAEEVTGRKFNVVKLVGGLGLASVEPRLNKLVDVQPMGVKEFITSLGLRGFEPST
ncbi:hypothetical protein CPB84DRAFT_1834754 [Gymnopilus junonius]|uniref:NmrA-like domain-containing protein n=1 Tax=Gymnopilus junonius TaxID=109634 RepID=A0A9P5NXP3_GYMJU|nr:hypothetical protein CPB84DRAFT_1834754 [Gymnopilus junonius]